MKIGAQTLRLLTTDIFTAVGSSADEAGRVAGRLVDANLVGHDSHGVMRVPTYVGWVREGIVAVNRTARVVFENPVLAIVDGQGGFGQVMGEAAMAIGIRKVQEHGVGLVALRHSGHLGRIGDWAEIAARSGIISLHWVNTSGFGLLVAPHGGTERRLSANPIAAGIPNPAGPPIVMDISTCAIAEGKIRLAYNRGERLPAGVIIDAQGAPTDDPAIFYAEPPGSILPLAGHKGFGLSVVAEVLAGALAGGGTTHPSRNARLENGMLVILVDPARLPGDLVFGDEIRRFTAWLKSCRTRGAGDEILLPGEIEARTRTRRLAEGIELDPVTLGQLATTARSCGLDDTRVRGILG